MKKVLATILLILIITPLKAQFHQGLYTFRNLPLNRLYNPSAEIRNEKEVLFPLISHLQVESELYGFTLQEIFSNNTANQTLEGFISTKNGREHLWINEMINLFYYGFSDKTSTKFWSFGVYQEVQAYSFYPADVVDVAYSGNQLDKKYNAGDLRTQGVALTVYHAGLTYKPKYRKYTFGGRIKIYNSMASVDAVHNNGSFTTIKNTSTNKVDILIDGKIRANSSGLNSFSSGTQIVKNSIFSGNMGLGADIGATYEFNYRWSTSISIIDVGAIYSSVDNSNYQLKGKHTFEGVTVYDPDSSSGDFWDEMVDRFNDDIEQSSNNNSFILTMPPKLFASVSYTIGGNKRRHINDNSNCSYHSSNYFTPKHHFTFTSYNKLLHNYWDWALGISYMGEINPWLGVQTNYLFSPYDKTNIGAGISFKINHVLIYFSIDNIPGLFDLNNTHSAGVFTGINIVF